ncbi:MAG: HD domain-containing protein [Rickettsiales bacterium]|jgi:HD superfamily phosphodiesterase|nr:HD domain-containing protein [Rickettsiales bacterium]
MDERYVASKILYDAYAENLPLAKSEEIQKFLIHKLRHSFDVAYIACDMMLREPELARLRDRERNIVELSAILHDLGRFYQHDGKAVLWDMDHGREGALRLKALGKLDDPAILFAIDEHDSYAIDEGSLPQKDREPALLAAKVVRDADKLSNIMDFSIHGVSKSLIEKNKGGALSDGIRRAISSRAPLLRRDTATYADSVVNYMHWYEDMNYDYTRRKTRALGYFENSFAILEEIGIPKPDMDLIRGRFGYD